MSSRFRFQLPLALAGSLAALLAGANLGAKEIKLPQETARYIESPLPGYQLASTLCMTCHSADYTVMQPVMPRAFWKAAVTKMQKTYGAPLPDDAIDPIAEYLAKTYGAERTAAPKADTPSARPNR